MYALSNFTFAMLLFILAMSVFKYPVLVFSVQCRFNLIYADYYLFHAIPHAYCFRIHALTIRYELVGFVQYCEWSVFHICYVSFHICYGQLEHVTSTHL